MSLVVQLNDLWLLAIFERYRIHTEVMVGLLLPLASKIRVRE